MDEEVIANVEAYVERRRLRLLERIGFGIHGIVFMVEGNAELDIAALKVHSARGPYVRERAIYERLREMSVTDIRGFDVPSLLDCDDELLVLKMTLVMPPFVLDFAGAYLDFPPQFSEIHMHDRSSVRCFGVGDAVAPDVRKRLEVAGRWLRARRSRRARHASFCRVLMRLFSSLPDFLYCVPCVMSLSRGLGERFGLELGLNLQAIGDNFLD